MTDLTDTIIVVIPRSTFHSSKPARVVTRGDALLVLPVAAWLAAAWYFPGFVKGDEVEILDASLQAAGRSLHFTPWSIRNILLPDLIGEFWLSLWPFIRDPLTVLWIATIPAIAGAIATMLIIRTSAPTVVEHETVARTAAFLYGLHWLPLAFATAPFPRAMTTPLVIGSIVLLSRDTPLRNVAAGILVGLAGASRYSEWMFAVSLASLMLLRRSPLRSVLTAVSGVGLGVLALLLYDYHTWGSIGFSLQSFFDYTFVQRASSSLETHQPWHWYLGRAHQLLAPPLWVFAWLGLRDVRLRSAGIAFVLIPLVVLSLVHHKELRYLQGLLPVLLLITAAGITRALESPRRKLYVLLLIAGLIWNGTQYRQLSKRPTEPLEIARVISSYNPTCVAMMQPWRFGNTLFLPGAEIREIPMVTSRAALAGLIDGCQFVSVFEDRLPPDALHGITAQGYRAIVRKSLKDGQRIVLFQFAGSDEAEPADQVLPPP